MAAAADKRADLDLQVSLLAEHEVTRLVTLVSGIADRMGVRTEADADLDEITQDVAPDAVLDELERRNRKPSSPDLSEGVCRHDSERGRAHPS
jgi:uncharacterized membrane protein